jgi:hypothetical protein
MVGFGRDVILLKFLSDSMVLRERNYAYSYLLLLIIATISVRNSSALLCKQALYILNCSF